MKLTDQEKIQQLEGALESVIRSVCIQKTELDAKRIRIDDLLRANNEFEQRARNAERELKAVRQLASP